LLLEVKVYALDGVVAFQLPRVVGNDGGIVCERTDEVLWKGDVRYVERSRQLRQDFLVLLYTGCNALQRQSVAVVLNR
jgi:hypothetical protein